MPPFLHKCLYCKKLWFRNAVESACPKCGSSHRIVYRLMRHSPEKISRRELLIYLGAFVVAAGLLVILR